MTLVILTGPQAVGKMTVGQQLETLTDLTLFHNHMTIDLVGNFFGYNTDEGRALVALFRKEIPPEFRSRGDGRPQLPAHRQHAPHR
jgi:hypothetical protein